MAEQPGKHCLHIMKALLLEIGSRKQHMHPLPMPSTRGKRRNSPLKHILTFIKRHIKTYVRMMRSSLKITKCGTY
jgi:hypothetical protein